MQCPTCGHALEKPLDFRVDLDNALLIIKRQVIKVRPRWAELAHILLEASPRPVPQETIVAKLFGRIDPPDTADATIWTYIYELRQILKTRRTGWAIRSAPMGRSAYALIRNQ